MITRSQSNTTKTKPIYSENKNSVSNSSRSKASIKKSNATDNYKSHSYENLYFKLINNTVMWKPEGDALLNKISLVKGPLNYTAIAENFLSIVQHTFSLPKNLNINSQKVKQRLERINAEPLSKRQRKFISSLLEEKIENSIPFDRDISDEIKVKFKKEYGGEPHYEQIRNIWNCCMRSPTNPSSAKSLDSNRSYSDNNSDYASDSSYTSPVTRKRKHHSLTLLKQDSPPVSPRFIEALEIERRHNSQLKNGNHNNSNQSHQSLELLEEVRLNGYLKELGLQNLELFSKETISEANFTNIQNNTRLETLSPMNEDIDSEDFEDFSKPLGLTSQQEKEVLESFLNSP